MAEQRCVPWEDMWKVGPFYPAEWLAVLVVVGILAALIWEGANGG